MFIIYVFRFFFQLKNLFFQSCLLLFFINYTFPIIFSSIIFPFFEHKKTVVFLTSVIFFNTFFLGGRGGT